MTKFLSSCRMEGALDPCLAGLGFDELLGAVGVSR
jgi:hypothetical protein